MRSILVAMLLAAGLLGAASCGSTGGNNGGAAGAGPGGAGAGGTHVIVDPCPGQCVPTQPDGWDTPDIVWFGDVASAPSCPQGTYLGYKGYADLAAPFDCGNCTCAPPQGSCTLPAAIAANAASCAENGSTTPHTPSDPASGWAGACDTNESIPSGKLCSGAHCVQSVTIDPLALNETACAPSQPPTPAPPAWKTLGMSCRINPTFECPNARDSCAPGAASGFKVCIYYYSGGDVDCAGFSPYSEKHVLYGDFTDDRSCSACACGDPSGSTCSSNVSLYTDGACTTVLSSVAVDATGPACVDVPSGSPLGSKSATPPVYAPGACAPGGGLPVGKATPIMPATFCCLPGP